MNKEFKGYDTTVIHDFKDVPDVKSGRCDNCDSTKFKSQIIDRMFVRECTVCGMKKSI
ncbi:hypothetical protein NKS29_16375 [Bacillus infantis]|jgi:hypothetical protein|nr:MULTISPECIES: hypothetical protein [Bacillus]MCP1159366.1 hypothetical protein [Bacillus infantis]